MKAVVLSINGNKKEEIELPAVFSMAVKYNLIHKAFVSIDSHRFQIQSRHESAGMDVAADTLNPPTGHGQARIARMKGGGGGRQGQAGGVASIRGGRQAHPPTNKKNIYKKINKNEKKLALCSAISATKSKELIKLRGHKINKIKSIPIIVDDELELVTQASKINQILNDLNLLEDIQRLQKRKKRSGKPALRKRTKKIGKSVLFVTKNQKNLSNACSSFPGVDVRSTKTLSVSDLAPGADVARLTVYTKSAINEISKIKVPHLELIKRL